jgi:hypothetical protein
MILQWFVRRHIHIIHHHNRHHHNITDDVCMYVCTSRLQRSLFSATAQLPSRLATIIWSTHLFTLVRFTFYQDIIQVSRFNIPAISVFPPSQYIRISVLPPFRYFRHLSISAISTYPASQYSRHLSISAISIYPHLSISALSVFPPSQSSRHFNISASQYFRHFCLPAISLYPNLNISAISVLPPFLSYRHFSTFAISVFPPIQYPKSMVIQLRLDSRRFFFNAIRCFFLWFPSNALVKNHIQYNVKIYIFSVKKSVICKWYRYIPFQIMKTRWC